MYEAKNTIELTEEEIEEVTGGMGVDLGGVDTRALMIRCSKWKHVTYMCCPRCKSWDDVYRKVTGEELPVGEVYSVTFHCQKCDMLFIERMF